MAAKVSALDLTSLLGSAFGALSKLTLRETRYRRVGGGLLRRTRPRIGNEPNGIDGNGRPFDESLHASYAAVLWAATT
jgi:hypothetical protein